MITRTIHGMTIQNASIIKGGIRKPFPYSTLNEKYNKQNPYDDTILPQIGWYGIGIDFSSLIHDDEADLRDYVHSVADFDTFLPLPFVARDKSIGLTASELDVYTMIVEKEINGTIYLLCYLRKIDALDTATKASELERSSDGIYNTVGYVQDVHPTPKLSTSSCNRFMITSNNALIKLTVSDMERLKDVSDLLYPEIDEHQRHSIREVALYSGIELENSVECLQACFFKYIELDLNSTEEYGTRLSIGSLTPKVKL